MRKLSIILILLISICIHVKPLTASNGKIKNPVALRQVTTNQVLKIPVIRIYQPVHPNYFQQIIEEREQTCRLSPYNSHASLLPDHSRSTNVPWVRVSQFQARKSIEMYHRINT
jgi:hypothetical protein